jgi:hypothetical protein
MGRPFAPILLKVIDNYMEELIVQNDIERAVNFNPPLYSNEAQFPEAPGVSVNRNGQKILRLGRTTCPFNGG